MACPMFWPGAGVVFAAPACNDLEKPCMVQPCALQPALQFLVALCTAASVTHQKAPCHKAPLHANLQPMHDTLPDSVLLLGCVCCCL